MDSSPTPVPTVRVARSRPPARRAVVVAVIAVVVAVLKPWPATPAANPALAATVASARPVAAASSIDRPVFRPDPSVGHDEIGCTGAGWQVVSLDRLADWTVRTWVPALPVVADGPLDTTIPRLALDGRSVLGVGACRPIDARAGQAPPTGPAGARIVHAWSRSGRAIRPLEVRAIDAAANPPRDPGLAILYRPIQPGTRGSLAPAWPAGEFILELEARDATSGPLGDEPPRWIALVVAGPTER